MEERIKHLKKRYQRLYPGEGVSKRKLKKAEEFLDVNLPQDLLEIASFFGGGPLGGIDHFRFNIDEMYKPDIGNDTNRIRTYHPLPESYIVLAESGERLILLDTEYAPAVFWIEKDDIRKLKNKQFTVEQDCWDTYEDFFCEQLLKEENVLAGGVESLSKDGVVRDFLRDSEYYQRFISREEERISKFRNAIDQVIRERGEEDEGVQYGYGVVALFYRTKLIALYSAGTPLDEIRAFVTEVVDWMEKTDDERFSYDHYQDCVLLLSLAILLEADEDLFKRICKLSSVYLQKDALIDLLIKGRNDTEQESLNRDFLFKKPYRHLENVLFGEDREQRLWWLKVYLQKYWYEGHDEAAWHDLHLHEDNIYYGYWSFESAAIVKILGLDDRELAGRRYYPHDLVHYNTGIQI
ncbi:PoNe immunity protein domain-containing protein [Bhargavaea ginsengi]|uniref:PoNe immunity protein domain-containing protein n=1 Tax=Bhargavaea ginsengi TaxID=426757 RepID=UPI003C7368D3